MEFASRWGRWGDNPAVLVNLNGAEASMSFTARLVQRTVPTRPSGVGELRSRGGRPL